MRSFIARRPLLATLLIILSDLPIILLGLFALPVIVPGISETALHLTVLTGQIGIAVAWLSALGWWRDAGFTRPSVWRELHLYWLPLAMGVLFPLLLGVQPGSLAALGSVVLLALLIGFQEEAVYRGLVVRAMASRGVVWTVLTSAILFGLIHAVGFLVRPPGFVLVQIIASTLGGIGLAALRLRTNTIWPLILLHAYNDSVQFLAVGGANYAQIPPALIAIKLIFPAVLAIYGLYLVRDAWLPALRRHTPAPARQ